MTNAGTSNSPALARQTALVSSRQAKSPWAEILAAAYVESTKKALKASKTAQAVEKKKQMAAEKEACAALKAAETAKLEPRFFWSEAGLLEALCYI